MLKLLNVMGLVMCLEIVLKIVRNFLETFGKFVRNLWGIGVTLVLIKLGSTKKV